MDDEETLSFIRRQSINAKYTFSVCTGALILGGAGLLRGKKATTHWAAFQLLSYFGILEPFPSMKEWYSMEILINVYQQRTPDSFRNLGSINSGNVLLSHNLEMHYHRGCSVSLPCSEWERVVPLR